MDLDHLTTAQVSQRALNIIKTQTAIDSVCFPETMQKMLIINAPRFFSLSWKIIKGWIDQRTAAKIEIISSRSSWEKRLKELVDKDQLPSDYGGTGPNTKVTQMENASEGVRKMHTELMHLRYVFLRITTKFDDLYRMMEVNNSFSNLTNSFCSTHHSSTL
mmetsp:Transcript_20133/g.29589  ORF Transcript_20133/g.29589 Transcript_20133/m.29589 type:complete len:161 (+) Transcript_20133:85-567(+)